MIALYVIGAGITAVTFLVNDFFGWDSGWEVIAALVFWPFVAAFVFGLGAWRLLRRGWRILRTAQ